jgi:hypothetical protein
MKPTLVISCHADTGFRAHRLSIDKNGNYFGHLDNFIGVYAVMQAYFSGKINYDNVRIELTYGEEDGMEGAYKVLKSLHKNDMAVVVDVTGIPTKKDITIEKCSDKWMQNFIKGALAGISYDLFEGCPDPIADEDESDVYREKLSKVCFLGIPCYGGDYNEEMVSARPKSIKAAKQALIRIIEDFNKIQVPG